MNLADKALRETNRTIDEIGRAIGYESAPSFSQAFTWLTGQSPGHYRRSLQPLGPTT
jgi:transcriptional regulator GlxA family with amidase domain